MAALLLALFFRRWPSVMSEAPTEQPATPPTESPFEEGAALHYRLASPYRLVTILLPDPVNGLAELPQLLCSTIIG
jgi:hypothetical protein